MCREAVGHRKSTAKFLRIHEVLSQLGVIVVCSLVVRGEYFLLCRTSAMNVWLYKLAFHYSSKAQPALTICRENGSLGANGLPISL